MAQVANEGQSSGNPSNEDDWKKDLFSSEPPEASDAGSVITLESTISVVKEGMWSLGDAALKSVAEVLVGFGISPTILGYTEEELVEDDDYVESGRIPIQKDEVVSKSSFALRSEENMNRRRQEEVPVVESEEEEVETYGKETDIISAVWGGDDLEGEGFGEDKKDK